MELQETEIWRMIPPEEKLSVMAAAHARGVLTAGITIVVAATVAIAFQVDWIFFGALILSPFIFQFASSKAWRGFRPRMMLEYLAARAAARRYAFAARAKELELQLLFRGTMEQVFDREQEMEKLEATIAHNKETEVWIALFRDAVILMSEKPGGAKLEFGSLINDKLAIEGINPDGAEGEYTINREVMLTAQARGEKVRKKIKVTSDYPAALVVFERKLLELQRAAKERQLDAPPSEERLLSGSEE